MKGRSLEGLGVDDGQGLLAAGFGGVQAGTGGHGVEPRAQRTAASIACSTCSSPSRRVHSRYEPFSVPHDLGIKEVRNFEA